MDNKDKKGKYDDIINLPHHVSDYHKPMPLENRAAQFAPFAALSGHEDAIAETSRITEAFKELSEQEKNLISKRLNYGMEKGSSFRIKYFCPDKRKSGGSYNCISGKIKKKDENENLLIMEGGEEIPINFISEIHIIK